jgi:hypothetical protein
VSMNASSTANRPDATWRCPRMSEIGSGGAHGGAVAHLPATAKRQCPPWAAPPLSLVWPWVRSSSIWSLLEGNSDDVMCKGVACRVRSGAWARPCGRCFIFQISSMRWGSRTYQQSPPLAF